MPFDKEAAVAVAADAARLFTEGLHGIALRAAEEVETQGQKLVEERKRLEEDSRALEEERRKLEADLAGLASERKLLSADRAALEGDKVSLEELRRTCNSERTSLNRDRAVLAQERLMFEKHHAELTRAREELCKERVDFDEAKELAAKKQALLLPSTSSVAPAPAPEESTETVVLNLGGEANVTVLLSTLLQCPESRFTQTFRRPGELPKDADGRIFVDFKPGLFMPLLEHLRMRRIEEPGDPTPAPQLDTPELQNQFNKMLQHYGLKEWVHRTATPNARPAELTNGAGGAFSTPTKPPTNGAAAASPLPGVSQKLQQLAQKVASAEARVQQTLQAAAPLVAEEAETRSVEVLKAASERTLEAEKSAALACAEAKKMLVAKQREEPQLREELARMQDKLQAAQQKLGGQRRVAVQGERLWKGKLALQAQELQVQQLEALVAKPSTPTSSSADALVKARAALQAAGSAADCSYFATLKTRVDRCEDQLEARTRPPAQVLNERMARAEQAVKRALLAAAPLTGPGSDQLAPTEAEVACRSVGKAEQEAAAKIEEVRSFLAEKQRQTTGQRFNEFTVRLNALRKELDKARADATNFEHRLVAKMIMQEVEEVVTTLQSQVATFRKEVERVVADQGRCFIVAGMVRMIAEALDEHRRATRVPRDTLFLGVGPGAIKGRVSQTEFDQYLIQVPNLCSQPNLAFSNTQRAAIFKLLDRDEDGLVSREDFMAMFCNRYRCDREVVLTQQLKVATGTIGKLRADEIVELDGDLACDAATGIIRAPVKVTSTGERGWVTVRSNTGVTFLTPLTPYQDRMKDLDQLNKAVQRTISEAAQCLDSKTADLQETTQDGQQGQLAQVKGDLAKVRLKIDAAGKTFSELRSQLEDFQRTYAQKDAFERRKSAENLERKASTLSMALEST